MDVDIDSFIREQKSKIATERQYLSHQNLSIKTPSYNVSDKSDSKNSENLDNFVYKMKEGENMKNKYKQELRNDYAITKEFNKHLGLSSRVEKDTTDKANTNGLLPGLGYSNSATKKKELIRNHEYNEFKKIEEENFKNRFQNKKSLSPRDVNNSHLSRNPITFDMSAKEKPLSIPSQRINLSFSPPVDYSNQNRNRSFESKVDILERKVDELRKFQIQDTDFHYNNAKEQQQFNTGYEPSFVPIKSSKSLRSLDETDKKLREIDEKYELSRANFMNNRRNGKKKINFILDDETILENQSFQRPFSDIGSHERPITTSEPSIVPTGRTDEETRKRLKQEQYRKDLENQMKEKSKTHKRIVNSISNENISFFDRFGQPANKPSLNKAESARAEISIPQQDSDYFYYASRNPLDELDSNPYVPSSFNINNQQNVNNYPNTNQPKSSIRIGSDQETNRNLKENYAEELKKQIEERKIRKEMDKRKQEEYERRKNEEIRNYDPFGRGGGGAPLKDNHGEVIADLKNVKFDSKIVIPPVSFRPQVDYFKEPEKPIISSDPNELKTYARGGHGIFGQALSDDDKIKAEKYKEDLKVQIELNKRQKEIEKSNERLREEKEREKFEKEQKLIQLELENEKKLQRQKEMEHIQKLEEHRIAAQESKKMKERLENKREEHKSSTPTQFRVREDSVVISPTPARNRTPLENKSRTPIEIKRNKTPIEKAHNDEQMTNNFYSLKAKLGQEMALLEKELAHQKDQVEIYDPRLEKNRQMGKSQVDNIGVYESDMVFDAVLQKKGPLSVRRGYFKPKRNRENSSINTEMDLDEHLKQQEKVLQRMHQNNFSRYELNMPEMNPADLSIRPSSQMSNQLESDTKFIDFQQSRDFTVKSSLSNNSNREYDLFKPLATAKPLRTNPEFGSNTSLNIDEITRKNQQRLRKLQKIQIENEKSQTTEEILNKFMISQDL